MSINASDDAALDFLGFSNVIDGSLVASKSGKTYHTVNPSTLQANPEVPLSTQEDADEAVSAARRAADGWADTPWEERKEALLLFAAAFESQSQGFAEMLVRENGKPVSILV